MTGIKTMFVNGVPFEGAPRMLDLHADYRCENAGECCRSGWNIAVARDERAAIERALRGEGGGASEPGAAFRATPPERRLGNVLETYDSALRCTAEGHCVFVEGERGTSACSLQRRFGHEVIPATCQSYPRIAVATPGGVYVTLTYNCPTAARSLLKAGGLGEAVPRAAMQFTPKLVGSIFGEGSEPPRFAEGSEPPDWAAFDYFVRWGVDWLAREDFAPAESLYLLGTALSLVEEHAAQVRELPVLVDMLEQVNAFDAGEMRAAVDRLEPHTVLGATYFEALLNIIAEVGALPAIYQPARAALAGGPGNAERESLLADYDRLIRPRLAEFATIERNYLASRLFANQLVYAAKFLRTGYFVLILALIQLRFTALVLCRAHGRELDEQIWLLAAKQVDWTVLHGMNMQTRLLELLQTHVYGNLEDLRRPAMF